LETGFIKHGSETYYSTVTFRVPLSKLKPETIHEIAEQSKIAQAIKRAVGAGGRVSPRRKFLLKATDEVIPQLRKLLKNSETLNSFFKAPDDLDNLAEQIANVFRMVVDIKEIGIEGGKEFLRLLEAAKAIAETIEVEDERERPYRQRSHVDDTDGMYDLREVLQRIITQLGGDVNKISGRTLSGYPLGEDALSIRLNKPVSEAEAKEWENKIRGVLYNTTRSEAGGDVKYHTYYNASLSLENNVCTISFYHDHDTDFPHDWCWADSDVSARVMGTTILQALKKGFRLDKSGQDYQLG
jgi:hypothetical protein